MTQDSDESAHARQDPDLVLDKRGLPCPMPVIALGRAARDLGSGLVELLADDPAAQVDVPAWCRMRGADLLGQEPVGDGYRFRIRINERASP